MSRTYTPAVFNLTPIADPRRGARLTTALLLALVPVFVATGEEAVAIHQRSDVCAVPAAGVVAEAMVALVVAQAVLEKFGGDSIAETSRNLAAYLEEIAARPPRP